MVHQMERLQVARILMQSFVAYAALSDGEKK
jgi:hypothetical protein